MLNEYNVKNTDNLLKLLSNHLSSRKRLKYTEYLVIIDESSVTFSSKEEVFPDTFHRKSGDRISILYHILIHHLDLHISDLISIRHSYSIHVPKDIFVPGRYIYKLSINQKHRKWIRLN